MIATKLITLYISGGCASYHTVKVEVVREVNGRLVSENGSKLKNRNESICRTYTYPDTCNKKVSGEDKKLDFAFIGL